MRASLLSLLCLSLAAGEVRMEAPISRARLYPDQAWLTREARFHFSGPGAQRLRLESLPPDLNLDDLRVQADGLPGLRLGNVAVLQEEGHFEPDVQTQSWLTEQKALLPRIQDLRIRQAALEAVLKTLEALKPQANAEFRATATVDPLSAAEFSRAAQARHQTLLQQGTALAAETKPLQARLEILSRLIQQREQAARRRTSTVVLELEAPEAGEAHIALETRTAEARWKPTYEVRLAEDGQHLELLCYAAVSQASGEDWNGVGLEISNAQPSRSLSLPVPPGLVQLLYEAPGMVSPGTLQGRITDRTGKPVAGLRLTAASEALKIARTVASDANGAFRFPFLPAGDYRLRGTKAGHPEIVASAHIEGGKTQSLGLYLGEIRGGGATVEVVGIAGALGASSAYVLDGLDAHDYQANSRFLATIANLAPGVMADPMTAALEPATSHFEDSGELGRAWFLEGARSLPSDAQPRRMLLAKAILDANLGFRAIPRLSTEVFTMALVTPTAGFPWFPSTPVTVFRSGERLGQIPLPSQSAGESVAFSFGPKAGLRVQRKRLEAKMVGAKGQKGRQWSLRERVILVNDLDQDLQVEVLEPNLRAVSDKVKVDSLPGATVPTRTTAQGLLAWTVNVPSRGQSRVEEGWKIQGPGTGFIPELPALGLPTSD